MQLLASLLVFLAAVGGFVVFGRGRRLRDRLFRRLVAVALIPALLVSGLAILGYSQALRLVEAPGLTDSSEAALDLARQTLSGLETRTALQLEILAGAGNEGPVPGTARLWRLDPRLREFEWGAGETSVESAPATPRVKLGGDLPWTGRVAVEGRTWTLAARIVDPDVPDGLWVLALPIPPDVEVALSRVQEGSRGLQQLRLYYGSLLREQGWAVGLLGVLMVLGVSFVISRRIADRLAKPLAELSTAVQQVSSGAREIHFGEAGEDELGQLQVAFAKMTRELGESELRLRRTERLAAWRQVARRLAHEIKNPLTPIHLAIHRLRKCNDRPEIEAGLEVILEETAQLQRLAEEFSTFARLPEPYPRPVVFGEVLDRVLKLYAAERRLELEGADGGLEVQADEGQLSQVLANLVKNAIEADPNGGTLHLEISRDPSFLRFEIEDEGPGIDAPVERIFEPDFTTKRAGTGLGLPICQRICEDHGARLEVIPSRGSGARLRLSWPLSRPLRDGGVRGESDA